MHHRSRKLNTKTKPNNRITRNIYDLAIGYLNLDLSPLPVVSKQSDSRFNGKNPSFLDDHDEPNLIRHGAFQDRQPTLEEIDRWFANPKNGIGILCNSHMQIIDVDAKHFDSPEECEQVVYEWLDKHPELNEAQVERTPSSGFHIHVEFAEPPGFTNFTFIENKSHIGEIRGPGQFAVVAPTVGYQVVKKGGFAPVIDAESIGLYSTKKAKKARKSRSYKVKKKATTSTKNSGALSLLELSSKSVQAIYHCQNEPDDRSAAIAKVANELYGWANWCDANNLTYDPEPWTLLVDLASNLDIDEDRLGRILASIDIDDCQPACVYEGGDEAAWKKVKKLSVDVELEEDTTKQLIDSTRVKPPQLFHNSLYDPLSDLASNLELPVEAFLVCILPILASRLKAETRLIIDPGTGYHVPPIIWAGLVGESGTMKSPILKLLTRPLSELQQGVQERYQLEVSEYEKDLQRFQSRSKNLPLTPEKPKPPKMRDLFFSDFTIEAIADSIRYHPSEGYLIHIDELAGFFKSMDAYRNGKGADRQRWLTFYGGDSLKVNRKSSEPIYIPKTSISLLGSIQPSVLGKLVLDDPTSEDGLWPRFLWFRLPITTPPGISDRPKLDLMPLLKGVYLGLNELDAQEYRLSRGAIGVWNEWNKEIGELIKQEPSNTLRAIYPKFKEIAGRIALIVHTTNWVIAKLTLTDGLSALEDSNIPGIRPIESEISAETLTDAIQFTKWLMGQTRSLYCEVGLSDQESSRVVRFINRFRRCGWIKARTVTQWWGSKPRPTAQQAREFMSQIVALGYAIDNRKPVNDSKYQIKITVSTSQSTTNTVGDKSVGISWKKVGYHPNRLKVIEDSSSRNSVGNVGAFLEKKDSTESHQEVHNLELNTSSDPYVDEEVCDDDF